MHPEIHALLKSRNDLLYMIRRDPRWYRLLTRDKANVFKLEDSAKYFYQKTWPQRLEKVSQNADMLNMILAMATMMEE